MNENYKVTNPNIYYVLLVEQYFFIILYFKIHKINIFSLLISISL